MEYPQVISLVPEGEHFDASAIGEGVWISTNHLDNIESSLANAETAVQAVQEKLTSSEAKVTELENSVTEVNEKLTAAETKAQEDAATIEGLQQQVAALGQKSSGNKGTTVVTKKDETVDTKPVPSYLDDNNPANEFADKRLKK